MDSLSGRTTGAYRVMTTSAIYLLDLDRMTVTRNPLQGDVTLRRLRQDSNPVNLIAVVVCNTLEPMVLDIDLGVPGVTLTRRTSTVVASIDPLSSESPLDDGSERSA
jgi:hypothetical protein